MSFESYFWNENQIKDKKVKSALKEISSDAATDEAMIKAFEILLSDSQSIGKGIAFDQYFYENSQSRFGKENPFSKFEKKLLESARDELQKPPFIGTTASGDSIDGANYASALNILALIGDESDIELIIPILRATKDASVIWSGCMAASTCLRDSDKSYPELLRILESFIDTKDISETTKIEAVDAVSESLTKEAEEVLIRVVDSTDFPVNVYAAIRLGERDISKHRKLLEKLSAELPPDAPYPASDLVDLLEESL